MMGQRSSRAILKDNSVLPVAVGPEIKTTLIEAPAKVFYQTLFQ